MPEGHLMETSTGEAAADESPAIYDMPDSDIRSGYLGSLKCH